MQKYDSKNLLLGVTGSVAAYRAADLAREAMRAGYTVRTCLTKAAVSFVTPALFEALTGQPCLVDVFEEPEKGRMAHIDWARWADVICIAPASASTINKISAGIGDNMLTTIALATKAPILIAPAMNPAMWESEPVQASILNLQRLGISIIEPIEGDVACGEHGHGKLANIFEIMAAIDDTYMDSRLFRGKKLMITSGRSEEPIDDVRYISNRSSGKMGAALANAALKMGADVTVVSGPASAPLPQDAKIINVHTADEFLQASLHSAIGQDIIIGAAAIGDYRVELVTSGKIRRGKEQISLQLIPNPDVIAELAAVNSSAKVIGFAAEPNAESGYVIEKLMRKGLFAIAANDVSRSDIGFGSDFNDLTVYFRDGRVEKSGKKSKIGCAKWLLQLISH